MDLHGAHISKVFASCVSCIGHALESAPISKKTLRLSVLRLRITRWGEAINIYGPPGSSLLTDYSSESDEAREVMIRLIELFKFIFEDTSGSSRLPTTELELLSSMIFEIDQVAYPRLQSYKSLLMSPPSGAKNWPRSLTGRTCQLIDELDDICPATKPQRELFASERQTINEATLRYIQEQLPRTDPWISDISHPLKDYSRFCKVCGDRSYAAPIAIEIPIGIDAPACIGPGDGVYHSVGGRVDSSGRYRGREPCSSCFATFETEISDDELHR